MFRSNLWSFRCVSVAGICNNCSRDICSETAFHLRPGRECITLLFKQSSRFIFSLIQGIVCKLLQFGCCVSINDYLWQVHEIRPIARKGQKVGQPKERKRIWNTLLCFLLIHKSWGVHRENPWRKIFEIKLTLRWNFNLIHFVFLKKMNQAGTNQRFLIFVIPSTAAYSKNGINCFNIFNSAIL